LWPKSHVENRNQAILQNISSMLRGGGRGDGLRQGDSFGTSGEANVSLT
jgi:hypothetical protein